MLVAGDNVFVNVIVLAAVLAGPIAVIALYWFGLRSARRHDEQHPR